MPALNIRFTEEELAQLRERASTKGVSMSKLAHDTVVNCGSQSDEAARWMAAAEWVIAASPELLARLADR